jgi:hypothetical protein
VARWTGALTHRAEHIEATAAAAREQGRRSAADELLIVLAHDLHNHLTPLRWRIDLLRVNAVEEDRPRDVCDTEMALRVVERLSRLVSDLLDVGRLDQGLFAVQPVPVELVALARSAAQELASPDVAIHPEGVKELLAAVDPDRLRQAIENLLGNAIKHSPKGKAVLIRIRTEMDADSAQRMALIEVMDQRPGVPPELLPSLFARFAKGRHSKGRIRRTGADSCRGSLLAPARESPPCRSSYPFQRPEAAARQTALREHSGQNESQLLRSPRGSRAAFPQTPSTEEKRAPFPCSVQCPPRLLRRRMARRRSAERTLKRFQGRVREADRLRRDIEPAKILRARAGKVRRRPADP